MKTVRTIHILSNHLIKLWQKSVKLYSYCMNGIWIEPENSLRIRVIKIVNLSIRSFTNRDLQMLSCALTYRTVLAIVPLMAMLFAIGRGFGFQNILESELIRMLPSQAKALKEILVFVDSYLAKSSEGIFVGIGVVFLLWTLISLLGHVEDAFNKIWGVVKGRSFTRKLTDYTAICMLLPVLLICSGGISIFMSTAVQSLFPGKFLSPIGTFLLDLAPFFLICLFFMGSYILIPNTKVKPMSTIVAALISGVATQVLQMLFVQGQIYVSNYNAIYGSFAFVPLLLIWIQLSWLICLSGVVLTHAVQNVVNFNFHENIKEISRKYLDEITVMELTVIVKRFQQGGCPYTETDFLKLYHVPTRLNRKVLTLLKELGFISEVKQKDDTTGFQPAFNVDEMTVGRVYKAINNHGQSDFLPETDAMWSATMSQLEAAFVHLDDSMTDTLLKNLPVEIKD